MSNKNYGIGVKGAVLAMALLAAGFVIAGYLYYQNSSQVQEVTMQAPLLEYEEEEQAAPVMQTEAVSPVTAASVPATVPVPSAPPVTVPAMVPETEAPVQKALQTASPIEGKTISKYAMDCLSYNETTRDWRTHNGIDLSAEDGAPVYAAADGTVYTTYEDDTLGNTVVIRHEGGYTTRYSSLSEELCVKAGDKVTLGQTIGYASDSALVETVMGSHVHFSVSCQDIPMDPTEFLAM